MIERHALIVEARFYENISDLLAQGAIRALEQAGVSYERLVVPGALEIPPAISMLKKKENNPLRRYAYIALGCVLRGETSHYDIVAGESARGLMNLGIDHRMAIGNGILTCDTEAQAIVRADPAQGDKGGHAVRAALDLLAIREKRSAAR
jgi:6,7-dimethyl-8-ribityllumazine synthase